MDLGIHLLLAHEMVGLGQEERLGCEFDSFFACAEGATPTDLIKRGIYTSIAVPLKGREWRKVSMVLLADALGEVPAARSPIARNAEDIASGSDDSSGGTARASAARASLMASGGSQSKLLQQWGQMARYSRASHAHCEPCQACRHSSASRATSRYVDTQVAPPTPCTATHTKEIKGDEPSGGAAGVTPCAAHHTELVCGVGKLWRSATAKRNALVLAASSALDQSERTLGMSKLLRGRTGKGAGMTARRSHLDGVDEPRDEGGSAWRPAITARLTAQRNTPIRTAARQTAQHCSTEPSESASRRRGFVSKEAPPTRRTLRAMRTSKEREAAVHASPSAADVMPSSSPFTPAGTLCGSEAPTQHVAAVENEETRSSVAPLMSAFYGGGLVAPATLPAPMDTLPCERPGRARLASSRVKFEVDGIVV